MKNKFLYFFILLVLFVLSCKPSEKDLSMEIEKLAISSTTDTVNFKLSNLISEEFDNYFIIPPYSNIRKVENDISIDLKKVDKTGIEQRDDIYVLCLIKDNVLTSLYKLSRGSVDFSEISDLSLIEKESDLILVKRQGTYYITKAR